MHQVILRYMHGLIQETNTVYSIHKVIDYSDKKPSSCSPPESHRYNRSVLHMQDHGVQPQHTTGES